MITIENINPELDKSVEIDTKRQLGITATVWVREKARQIDMYDLPVDTWQVGKDRDGNEIRINTLGRWLFGVPNYDGHVRIVPNGSHVTIHHPSEPVESEELFTKLKTSIEGEGVQNGL
jgi:uncharacterized short protein YbdD (DUF466 family)